MSKQARVIPKTIHYCWFGGKKKNNLIKKCIKSWKNICPDFEIVEWNENNFNIHCNRYVEEAYKKGKWAFVTDYARLWIIYNYGGIYLDTDVELIKSPEALLEYKGFFALEHSGYIATGLGFAAQKGDMLVRRMLDDYRDLSFINEEGAIDDTPCPVRNKKALSILYAGINQDKKMNIVNDYAVLNKEFFCPYVPAIGKMTITENTIGIHWYSATWRSKSINIRQKMLRPVKRIMTEKRFNKIRDFIRGKK